MNFGEKLKQIRLDRGLTQPQFAETVGIEQSYLSKLENDKSVPSAEMFATILSGLGMDAATFLKDLDSDILATTLKHIPAVSQFTHQTVAVQVHEHKKWLYGSALAWVLGFALMLAANDGIFFANTSYTYASPGVILEGEAENIFDRYDDILALKRQAQIITLEEFARQKADFESTRSRPVTVELASSRGTVYFEPADKGRRRYELIKTESIQAPGNRMLQFIGAIVMVCGFVGLFIEWRLRRLNSPKRR